jgi:hypothetical protein
VKWLLQCALWLSCLGGAGAAAALPVTLTLVPSSTVLAAGETLSVEIVVGGLFDDAEIALESFDLELAFDDDRLAFQSFAFGGSLGGPNQTFATGPGNPNVNGVVKLGLFSKLTEPQLLALQDAPFVLATIDFEALANPGPALLELINLYGGSLGGVAGQELGALLEAPDPLLVTVVPEPGVVVLLAAASLLARRGHAARS